MNTEKRRLFDLLSLLVGERALTGKGAEVIPMDGQWIIRVTGRRGGTFDKAMVEKFDDHGYVWISYERSWHYPTITITQLGLDEYQRSIGLSDELSC